MRGISCHATATSAMIYSFPSSSPRCQRTLLAQRWLKQPNHPQFACRHALSGGTPPSCRNLTASAARNAKRAKGAGGGAGGDGQLIQLEEDGSDAWRLEPALQSIRSGGVRGLMPIHTEEHLTSPHLSPPAAVASACTYSNSQRCTLHYTRSCRDSNSAVPRALINVITAVLIWLS